jgi:4-aminobutyrate aminotransferase-like enzyme
MARNYTNAEDVIAVESAYHGNTAAAVAVSEYKFGGPGGKGCPPTTHVVPLPCVYRGRHKGSGSKAGQKYAAHVALRAGDMSSQGRGPATFIAESMISVGGQIILPDGYLTAAYEAVRQTGGVCIADEVQVGFGRPGKTFWGFELQDAVPDIVTLGKPIGNGHPLGAVVTTPAIAEAFDNGMEYFNTFGGNPVSCAIGLAVLNVIEKEQLQKHALDTGATLLDGLESLKDQYDLIGDVRGRGLFAGIELVRDPDTLEPARDEAYDIINRMRDRGILLSVDGPLHNVIKIKPPMVITADDIRALIEALDEVLDRLV